MVRPGDWHPVSDEGEFPSASLQYRTTMSDSLNPAFLEDESANQRDSSRPQYQLVRSFCRFSALFVSMVFIAEALRRSDALRDRHADTTDYLLREYYGEESTEASFSRGWRRFLVGSTKVQQPHHSHHVIEEAHAALWPLTTSDWVGLICVVMGCKSVACMSTTVPTWRSRFAHLIFHCWSGMLVLICARQKSNGRRWWWNWWRWYIGTNLFLGNAL